MKMQSRHFLYIFLAILLCLIIFLLRSFFYNHLVDPITRIVWLIVRSLLSVDQEILWILLILLGAFVALLIFPNDQRQTIRSSFIDSNDIEDKVSYWKKKFHAADQNADARISLQQSLISLADSLKELYGNTGFDEIILPMHVDNPWQYFWARLKFIFGEKSSFSGRFSDSELEKTVSQLLDSMESTMERQND